jgi:hypothetical protein
MRSWGNKSSGVFARRAFAAFACLLVLYFASGSLLHQHSGGPDTACHICQSLHLPVLAPASLDLVSTPELIARYSSLPQLVTPQNSFCRHHPSRAPPTA